MASDNRHNPITCARDSAPAGSSRPAVRGLRGVELGVDEAVHRHRERTCADHGDRHPDHVRPSRARRRSRGTHRRTRTGARRPCARSARATRGAVGERVRRLRSSRLPVGGRRVARCELETVPQRGLDHRKPVPTTPGRPGEVHDQRGTARPAAPRERSACGVRASASALIASARPGASRSRTPRVASGRHVAGRETRPSGGENERNTHARKLANRGGDQLDLVGDDPALNVEVRFTKQRLEDVARRILANACADAVGHGHDGRVQAGSFVFSTSWTSSTTIERSIAFAMS